MPNPTGYTEELAAEICAQLADGKSLRSVCRADDMPSRSMVFRWIADRKEFRAQYEEAMDTRTHLLADELIDIADDGKEDVQRSRLRVDARKWVLSKMLPKKYGDRVTTALVGADDGPIQVEDVTPLERARKIAFALRLGAEEQKQDGAD